MWIPPGGLSFRSDYFQRPNANPIGPPYSAIYNKNSIVIVSDIAQGFNPPNVMSALDTTYPYLPAQFAQCTLSGTPINGSTIYLYLRVSNPTSANVAGMLLNVFQGSTTAKIVSDFQFNAVATFTLNSVPAAGDVYTFWVIGQTYYVAQNGAIVCTYYDTTALYASGTVGFGGYYPTTTTDITFSNFTSGDFRIIEVARPQATLRRRGTGGTDWWLNLPEWF